jgi:rubredoxin
VSSAKKWICVLCGFIYDEAAGLPEEGLAPGTAWSSIPDEFECPDCGFGKADFEMVEIEPPHPSFESCNA